MEKSSRSPAQDQPGIQPAGHRLRFHLWHHMWHHPRFHLWHHPQHHLWHHLQYHPRLHPQGKARRRLPQLQPRILLFLRTQSKKVLCLKTAPTVPGVITRALYPAKASTFPTGIRPAVLLWIRKTSDLRIPRRMVCGTMCRAVCRVVFPAAQVAVRAAARALVRAAVRISQQMVAGALVRAAVPAAVRTQERVLPQVPVRAAAGRTAFFPLLSYWGYWPCAWSP